MNILEKEIEDLICDCLDRDVSILRKRGLTVYPYYIRQLELGSYGIADIVTFEKYGSTLYVKIFELKKEIIDTNTLVQAAKYAKGIDRMLKNYNIGNHGIVYSFALIGKTIQRNGDFVFLCDMLNIDLYTYSIDMEYGVIFNKECNFHHIKETTGKFNKKQKNYILKSFYGERYLDADENLIF